MPTLRLLRKVRDIRYERLDVSPPDEGLRLNKLTIEEKKLMPEKDLLVTLLIEFSTERSQLS